MKFSERMGLRAVRAAAQVDSMDDALRNRLWNVLSQSCWRMPRKYDELTYQQDLLEICHDLWNDHFKTPIDTIPRSSSHAVAQLRNHFFGCESSEAYDFLEFVVTNRAYSYIRGELIAECNRVLEEELSGYRFISGRLAPISTRQEVDAIERAIAETAEVFPHAAEHLRTAIGLLAQKPAPDLRNSIKESISAVESLCVAVTGKDKATLPDALKMMYTEAELHGALRVAFEKLYAYTSDDDGIRHGLLKEGRLELEDATFMLVACSAFVSYVTAKHARKGNQPKR